MSQTDAKRHRSLAAVHCELTPSTTRRTALSTALTGALSLAALILPLRVARTGPSATGGANDSANQPLSQSVEALAAGIQHEPPSAAFETTKVLWEAGRKDDAVFFFYLGQLRFRARLLTNPKLDPSGEPALFNALMATMGPPINQYAFGDIQKLVATVDRVIAWDDGHADDYASSAARESVKAGLRKMRDAVLARQDEIRRTRSEKGLPNRAP
jgi:hypothetical protein